MTDNVAFEFNEISYDESKEIKGVFETFLELLNVTAGKTLTIKFRFLIVTPLTSMQNNPFSASMVMFSI